MNYSSAFAILVSGLPGSGKSYFAKRLAPALHAAYFSSDIMRNTLTPDRTYSESEKAAVYAALVERMSNALRATQTVVLDATFHKAGTRAEFVKAAKAANALLFWIEIRANKSVVRARLQHKREDSDADFGVYLTLRNAYEPIQEPHLVLHSDKGTVEEMVAHAIAWLEEQK